MNIIIKQQGVGLIGQVIVKPALMSNVEMTDDYIKINTKDYETIISGEIPKASEPKKRRGRPKKQDGKKES